MVGRFEYIFGSYDACRMGNIRLQEMRTFVSSGVESWLIPYGLKKRSVRRYFVAISVVSGGT